MASAALGISLVLPGGASADEIKTTIQEALGAYQEGDLAAAKESLGYAIQLISQKNASKLGTILPQALAGWTAKAIDLEAPHSL